ncbi:SAM-dependent methyltransferase [Pelagibacteraceae bacterium]|jgi:NADH dehydrogenase [ubiquinone] 1 alpha subcomplex assembly factor 7|nr:SAM-dependent methyltransferase [Pelagibacteraceae bacterium]
MRKIINILKEKKSIPLDKFINISLYDKKFGYYMKKNPFGKKGDFITSPMVSNLFGEMLAIWCVAFWENLGKPSKIILVELGPGNGTLCSDLLKTFKQFKNFYNSLEINLLEISDKLRLVQKTKINNKKVKWIKEINEINYGPIIFLGNEFFDALPVKQIYRKKKSFFEKYVTLSNDKKKIKFLLKKANNNLIKNIKKLNLISDGSTIEYPVEAIKFLKVITKKVNKFGGGLLVFDYGYTVEKNQSTLQSIKKHKHVNIFTKPGHSDITSHLNFKLFYEILRRNNLDVKKITNQNEFLKKMGILERANILSQKMTFKAKADMFYRLRRLLDSKEMGELFKVIFAQKKNKKFSLGF